MNFVETTEYRRFAEFCDACADNQWIGLCHGAPGVGKTLSGRHYARWDTVAPLLRPRHGKEASEIPACNVIFFTGSAAVANAPAKIDRAIRDLQESLSMLDFEKRRHATLADTGSGSDFDQHSNIRDTVTLMIIDEVDLLKMSAVEQLRAIYDRGGIGMVLIGMPGLEKRLARYPQLYSRVGFVHEFRPLSQEAMRQLLRDGWRPVGVSLTENSLDDDEATALVVRMAQGKFRLLHRLLTQISRILEINGLDRVTVPVIEAARESLVIGTA